VTFLHDLHIVSAEHMLSTAFHAVRTQRAIVAAFALAANLFRAGFTDGVPVTAISQRAGLVMNPAQDSTALPGAQAFTFWKS
jgi:hypothetical protein